MRKSEVLAAVGVIKCPSCHKGDPSYEFPILKNHDLGCPVYTYIARLDLYQKADNDA